VSTCDDEGGCGRAPADPPIACTLAPADMPVRLAAWQDVVATVVAREPIDNGVRLILPTGASLGSLADLVAAEHQCCMFLRFAITVDTRGAALEVSAPTEAIDVVHSLFGAPA
jgi:hypothetical protein